MSAFTAAANDELDAQLLAQNNIIDGLSLALAQQRAVMRQALVCLEQSETTVPYEGLGISQREAIRRHMDTITALRNALEGRL